MPAEGERHHAGGQQRPRFSGVPAVQTDDDRRGRVAGGDVQRQAVPRPPAEEVYSKASADPPADVSVLDWTAELPTSRNPDHSAALTTALAAELAEVDPLTLLAVTTTRIVWPTSPAVSL